LIGPDGLVILDVSDYQFRRPNPEIRIISKLFWDDQGVAEPMYPVTVNGRPYIISGDESGGSGAGVVGGPPAVRTAFLPGSGSWSPGVDRTMDRIAGYMRFKKVPATETHGRELHLWVVSDGNGFQVLRFTNSFKARHKDLFEKALQKDFFEDSGAE
jgi:hypothetical protein